MRALEPSWILKPGQVDADGWADPDLAARACPINAVSRTLPPPRVAVVGQSTRRQPEPRLGLMDRIRIAATFTRAGMAAGLEELVNQARKTGWGILEALTPKVRYAL